MIIDENLLLKYGADYEYYNSNDIIFKEGDQPKFYYQIVKGTIELGSYHVGGKESLHDILSDGQCFGESLLFLGKPYQFNASTKSQCSVLKLCKRSFISLLAEHPDVTENMFKCLSDKIYYKNMMLFSMASPDPCFKIKSIMDYYKNYNLKKLPYSYQVPFTRRQLASLIGLCTETVIRNIKKMEGKKMLKIENGKIYY